MATGGLRNAIGSKLFPLLQPLVDGLTRWIAANRGLIASDVENVVRALAEMINSVDWTAFNRFVFGYQQLAEVNGEIIEQRIPGGLERLIRLINEVVGWIGGWKVAAVGLVLFINAQFVTSVINLGKELGSLAVKAALAAGKLALLAGAGMIDTVRAFFLSIRYGTGIMAAFNIALAANPIGLLVAAIALLAAAVYLIYDNWETVGPFFQRV